MNSREFINKYFGSLSLIMRGVDIAIMVLSGVIAFWIRFHTFHIENYYLMAFLISALLTALIFPRFDVYVSHRLEKI